MPNAYQLGRVLGLVLGIGLPMLGAWIGQDAAGLPPFWSGVVGLSAGLVAARRVDRAVLERELAAAVAGLPPSRPLCPACMRPMDGALLHERERVRDDEDGPSEPG